MSCHVSPNWFQPCQKIKLFKDNLRERFRISVNQLNVSSKYLIDIAKHIKHSDQNLNSQAMLPHLHPNKELWSNREAHYYLTSVSDYAHMFPSRGIMLTSPKTKK